MPKLIEINKEAHIIPSLRVENKTRKTLTNDTSAYIISDNTLYSTEMHQPLRLNSKHEEI